MVSIAADMMDSSSGKSVRWVVAILVILHAVGIAGLHTVHYSYWFETITWLNLLVSFTLVLSYYRGWTGMQVLFIAAAMGISLMAEIIGVQRGILFGAYHYERMAGPGLLGVPLVIGLNWVLLTICTGTFAAALFHHTGARILIAAAMMVGIDILLEQFAIRHHLWAWDSSTPPLFNYLTWGAVALVLQLLYAMLWKDQGNKIAVAYLVILLLFLVTDRLFAHGSMHMGAWTDPHHLISFDHVAKAG